MTVEEIIEEINRRIEQNKRLSQKTKSFPDHFMSVNQELIELRNTIKD